MDVCQGGSNMGQPESVHVSNSDHKTKGSYCNYCTVCFTARRCNYFFPKHVSDAGKKTVQHYFVLPCLPTPIWEVYRGPVRRRLGVMRCSLGDAATALIPAVRQ